MGATQTMLLTGGLIMLVILSLTFYTSYRSKSDMSINSEALTTAIAVGQSMFDLIQTRAYDERTISKAVYSTDSLTITNAFATDADELTVTQYDDVNDFHNHISYDTLGIFGIFSTRMTVNYANKMNPNSISSARSFTKRVDITVWNQYLSDTLKLRHVIAY